MKREQVFEFFRRLAEANPAPTTELEYSDPYSLLVAVVLSAQATDAGVNIATRPLFAQIKSPQQMKTFLDQEEAMLRKKWYSSRNIPLSIRYSYISESTCRP